MYMKQLAKTGRDRVQPQLHMCNILLHLMATASRARTQTCIHTGVAALSRVHDAILKEHTAHAICVMTGVAANRCLKHLHNWPANLQVVHGDMVRLGSESLRERRLPRRLAQARQPRHQVQAPGSRAPPRARRPVRRARLPGCGSARMPPAAPAHAPHAAGVQTLHISRKTLVMRYMRAAAVLVPTSSRAHDSQGCAKSPERLHQLLQAQPKKP